MDESNRIDSESKFSCSSPTKEMLEDIQINMSSESEGADFTLQNKSIKFVGEDNLQKRKEIDDDEEGFKIVTSQKEKKRLKVQGEVDIYIFCKEKIHKQFALARLFKEEGIIGINKIKYLNPYKIRVTAKDEVVANNILFCKKFSDMDWRCHRAIDVNVSYGVIKGVDLDLDDQDILKCISCPEPSVMIGAKRLQKRDVSGKWVPCDVARLAFQGTVVPSHVFVDQLRIAVEPYIFPVSQCSRCWKLGHISRFCSSKNIICPKCGGAHENCTTKIFKCVNCAQNHMALERLKCPIFLKEKKLREIMSEFRCSYRTALTMYVKPENTTHYVEKTDFPKATSSGPSFVETKVTQEPKNEGVNDNESSYREKTDKKYQKKKKTRKNVSSQNNMEYCWWSSSSDEEQSLNNFATQENKNSRRKRPEREVTFSELLVRLKEVIFIRGVSFKEKVGQVVKLCVEWLALVVFENISEWSLLKTLFESFSNI